MPERPDLRKIAGDIREALDSYPREALVDILAYVFQAYVVEGTPTVAVAAPEAPSDLTGLSFAELVTQLQLRLDLPELALLEVQNGRVHVRVGGQLVPLVAGAREAAVPLTPAAPPPPPEPAREPLRQGVNVHEVPPSQLRPPAAAPPPVRGLSVNPGGSPRPAPAPAAPAPAPAQPATPASKPAEETPDAGDPASKRFSLLDID